MRIEMREVVNLNKEEYEAYCATMAVLAGIHCNTKDSALSELTMDLWQSLENLDEEYFFIRDKEEK